MPGRAGKAACGSCGNCESACDRKGVWGVGRIDSGRYECTVVSLPPCIFVLPVSLGGILSFSRTHPIIDCRTRGVSVRGTLLTPILNLQRNIGGPRTAREKVPALVQIFTIS